MPNTLTKAENFDGRMLGATEMYTGVSSAFQSVTDTYVNVNVGGSAYLKVAFVVPPSNKVKITVHFGQVQRASGDLQFGLATDTSATTLGTRYERKVWDIDESDHVGIFYEWYVDGSDVSWSVGESKTIYAMVRADSSAGRLMYGITGSDNYNSWTMEAIALPATIGDGS